MKDLMEESHSRPLESAESSHIECSLRSYSKSDDAFSDSLKRLRIDVEEY
jgi:hypothetical protein